MFSTLYGTYFSLTLSQTSPGFTCLKYKSFENTVGKGEIARNEQFLLFPHSVFNPLGEFSAIFVKFEIVTRKLFQVGRALIFLFGKGLNALKHVVCSLFQSGPV